MLGTLLSMVFFLAFLPFIVMFYIFKWSLKVVIYLILIFSLHWDSWESLYRAMSYS